MFFELLLLSSRQYFFRSGSEVIRREESFTFDLMALDAGGSLGSTTTPTGLFKDCLLLSVLSSLSDRLVLTFPTQMGVNSSGGTRAKPSDRSLVVFVPGL